ncbi:hypothetical protein SO802_011518 [Lithocarpus litseifolius]|uniref:Protein kinase domain-containing protein n=1 Tax=Lithocarpus litseifolius TaxID=425828 RepID=A0AAW2D0U7_9ROSI
MVTHVAWDIGRGIVTGGRHIRDRHRTAAIGDEQWSEYYNTINQRRMALFTGRHQLKIGRAETLEQVKKKLSKDQGHGYPITRHRLNMNVNTKCSLCNINRLRVILQGFNLELSDFELAKYGPQGDQSHVSSRILGTKGDFAFEYIGTGHLTLKTDVYSFGVVLLEIFSGNCAAKKFSNGLEGNLVQWAKPYLSNKLDIHGVINKRIGENFPREGAQEFAWITLQCLGTDPTGRPEMREVVANLERLEKYVRGGATTTNFPGTKGCHI